MTLLEEMSVPLPRRQQLAGCYAAFLQHAFNPDAGRFRNFMSFERHWVEDFGSEDSHARALWALGTCVLKAPHDGVPAMLSPGTFGHGGAWGTQAWVDPVKGVAYVLMVQRSNFPNSDASEVRRVFQQAATKALAKP
jgi:CubicO group peptidase (beta-lactamase class C family)